MKPVVVDTSVWVDWLRGSDGELKDRARGRILFMPAIVALELRAGARNAKSLRVVSQLVDTFARHQRVLVPRMRDFMDAGGVLARLAWPASTKSNDVLIAVLARSIGATVWTKNRADFEPLRRTLRLSLE